MQTIAFKVKPDTDLYKNYFSQKKEKAFFNKLARTFLEEHIPEFKMYGLTDRLTVGLSEENARKYQGQLMKGVRYFDGEPLYQFKSRITKAGSTNGAELDCCPGKQR